MKYGVLAFCVAVAAASAAEAQGMWWVEGDRFCSDFGNRSRNSAMCGNPKKGEVEPKPTYKLDFNFPAVPFVEDQKSRGSVLPAPTDRPRTQQRQ
jgi:hypothetical protein